MLIKIGENVRGDCDFVDHRDIEDIRTVRPEQVEGHFEFRPISEIEKKDGTKVYSAYTEDDLVAELAKAETLGSKVYGLISQDDVVPSEDIDGEVREGKSASTDDGFVFTPDHADAVIKELALIRKELGAHNEYIYRIGATLEPLLKAAQELIDRKNSGLA